MMWWWLGARFAAAEDPPAAPVPAVEAPPPAAPSPVPDPGSAPFPEVLAAAKQAWFLGRAEEAREAFAALHGRILGGEDAALADVAEALTWLGEIQYLDDDLDAARLTFRDLLRRAPDTPISPYHHPTEVVNLFELVRAEVKAERAPPPEPEPPTGPPPTPLWVWAPLGVPQLVQGRPGAGALFGGLQLALGATSVASFVHLSHLNRDDQPGIPPGGAEERALQTWRYAVQWPSTALFYGAWLVGSREAARHHRRAAPVPTAFGGAPGLGLVGRF